jgi:nucleoside-diphosphate-sugar epimerase
MIDKKHKILIIGGLGFIGKNLYVGFKENGIEPDIFSNVEIKKTDPFNSVFTGRMIIGDIALQKDIKKIIDDYSIIYSLAGISGAAMSNYSPQRDIGINVSGHLNILEACRKMNQKVKIIFPSSRLVYGRPRQLPVNEAHTLNPQSVYAIHKLTAEYYYLLYRKLYGIESIVLRISNPYGPYQDFSVRNYGIINHFIMQAIKGETINIFGDGAQMRDYLYISDLTDLMIRFASQDINSDIYNVGLGKGISLKQAVMEIKKHVTDLHFKFIPWPKDYLEVETGDYTTDISKILHDTGWKPEISIEEGIKLSIRHYRDNI